MESCPGEAEDGLISPSTEGGTLAIAKRWREECSQTKSEAMRDRNSLGREANNWFAYIAPRGFAPLSAPSGQVLG
jgi:hypothetical protein